MYTNITFPISSFRTFTYKIPKGLKENIIPGVGVRAPINNRLQIGFVISIQHNTEYNGTIFEIDSILETEFHIPKELWDTIIWVSKYYITPIGKVLKAAIPNSFIKSANPQKILFVKISANKYNKISNLISNKPAQKRILDFLYTQNKAVKISSLIKYASSPYLICKKLQIEGLVKIIEQAKTPDPFYIMSISKKKKIKLSIEQQNVVDSININNNKFQPYLLHGVTGSGKTEIYLKIAQSIVKQGKTVIVLVPEIVLTPQVATKFREAFGRSVALWHSRMTKSEKGWTWKQLKNNKYSVIVGARSAIFCPLNNLGLIIVDEEQESSYKQENPVPRYNARDVAIVRGKNANAIVLLTSATPCLESYYNGLNNKFKLLKLNKRYGKSNFPNVKLVNMKKEFYSNNNSIISTKLLDAINNCIIKSEQIIILQNRRGYSRVHQCLECGEIKMCKKCSVALTYHQSDNKLHCHYCNLVTEKLLNCLSCNSENLVFNGSGTQQVEEILNKNFPNAKILRMDLDTVKKKNSLPKILKTFSDKKADILLGTQMIAKGLDFENVTLVGIINADSGLFFPDFRAGERVFQLIYQVTGRAGRRNKLGQAIIQTYNPNDIYIQTASMLDIRKFYNIALAHRKELNYPPFSRIARILIFGKNKSNVEKISINIKQRLNMKKHFTILGPSFAPIEKISDNWRNHIIIKTNNKKMRGIQELIKQSIGYAIFERKWNGVKIQIDIDPVSLL